jgi:hypothetical protein
MRCPVVIGRDDELSAIAGLVARGCGTALGGPIPCPNCALIPTTGKIG